MILMKILNAPKRFEKIVKNKKDTCPMSWTFLRQTWQENKENKENICARENMNGLSISKK